MGAEGGMLEATILSPLSDNAQTRADRVQKMLLSAIPVQAWQGSTVKVQSIPIPVVYPDLSYPLM